MIELDSQLIENKKEGEKVGISGNTAVARGLIESSVKMITSYPGTPCAEVIESLVPFSEKYKFHVEWSVNEKVAFEVAAAAAMSGLRSAFVTKHVGMNVAADALMHICYAGVTAGMVVISADDPGAFDSPIEQDTRFYAKMAEIIGMEPSSQQEAKDMVVNALALSEKTQLPVFLRITNRILYGRGKVAIGKVQDIKYNAQFENKNLRWFIAGKNAVKQHQWLHKQQVQLNELVEKTPFNKCEWAAQKKYGVITTGIGYYYAKEAIKDLLLEDQISILKISCFNPLPENWIKQFLNNIEEILVIEELEPFIEEKIKGIAFELEKKVNIYGKLSEHLSHTDALSPEMVRSVISQLWLVKQDVLSEQKADKLKITQALDTFRKSLPYSYLVFCSGCPHRASFYVLKQAIKKTKQEFIVTGDIGCYLLGKRSPFALVDTVFCMGASIGIGCGLSQTGVRQRVVATIGDSTFLHAGIPALINCSYSNVDILVYILDNGTVAMTGLQPYPGVGITAEGKRSKAIKLEDIVKACGVNYVKVIDPFKVRKTERVLSNALKMRGQRVVIARHECAQLLRKKTKEKKICTKLYKIDNQRCRQCKLCITALKCPAILVRNKKVYIDKFLCSGCGLCSQVCPFKAIVS